MNGTFWDHVQCDGEIEVELSGDRKAKGRCDGVMLPVERIVKQEINDDFGVYILKKPVDDFIEKLWVCHKCGREVK